MRDGTVVEDPRLGRLRWFNPRSRLFSLAERLEVEQMANRRARAYTWNTKLDYLDQNGYGGCVSWTLGYDLDARPKHVPGVTNTQCLERYFQIQDRDPFAGSERPGASPQSAGTTMTAGADQMVAEGAYERYDWADFDDPLLATKQVLQALAWRGPVPLGVNWYAGMNHVDPDGFIHPTGRLLGGHSILAVGINLRYQAVKLKQSWGPSPLLLLNFDDLTTLLSQGGEAYSPTRRSLTKRWRLTNDPLAVPIDRTVPFG